MLKSLINGNTTTPTMLAKEIVFFHGEHAVVALPRILGAAGMSVTEREYGLISEQVVLNHDAIKFDEAAASKRINETKGA
ncbi:hypothetical protein [Klebsiella pneumoniae]|uniref:hypothetical protein n=1 Tax=Klebsiella pneumoniae TaxID=573 RepID=UPI0009BA8697|nr:hypothetical protein [Klebsiella pneumoniae]SLV91470.1 Uncharacterised protein [Klebsiella pneumoniae]